MFFNFFLINDGVWIADVKTCLRVTQTLFLSVDQKTKKVFCIWDFNPNRDGGQSRLFACTLYVSQYVEKSY